jgi:hypothetical protein
MSIVKPRRKRENVTGRFTPITPEKTLAFLIDEQCGTVLIDDATNPNYTTPKSIRDKGIIICCECGQHNSDSRSDCKYCHEPLIYIKP